MSSGTIKDKKYYLMQRFQDPIRSFPSIDFDWFSWKKFEKSLFQCFCQLCESPQCSLMACEFQGLVCIIKILSVHIVLWVREWPSLSVASAPLVFSFTDYCRLRNFCAHHHSLKVLLAIVEISKNTEIFCGLYFFTMPIINHNNLFQCSSTVHVHPHCAAVVSKTYF